MVEYRSRIKLCPTPIGGSVQMTKLQMQLEEIFARINEGLTRKEREKLNWRLAFEGDMSEFHVIMMGFNMLLTR